MRLPLSCWSTCRRTSTSSSPVARTRPFLSPSCYHHLFADVLRSRLQQEQPERIRELHRRAAAFYERNGWTSEAIRHALAAQEHDRAADLVEDVARKMWNRGEVVTLLGWLEALPEETKRRRPQLLLQYSAALLWA